MSAALIAQAEAHHPRVTAEGHSDEKCWARRFIFRAERGDKDLLPIQIQFAYLALDRPMPKGGNP